MSRLPFEAFLALRYLRPRRTFVSVITVISIVGVLLGVAVLIIDGVVNLARLPASERGHQAGDNVVPVNHVQEPLAASGNARLVLQELLEKMAAARPVYARHAQDDGREFPIARRVQQESLGLRQHPARFVGRLGPAAFLDNRAVGLAIDAGAACIDEFFGRRRPQPCEQIARSAQIDLPVILQSAAVRRDSIDNPIEHPGQSVRFIGPGDVGCERLDAASPQFRVAPARPREAKDLMAQPGQFRAQRQTDITAAENQNTHRRAVGRIRETLIFIVILFLISIRLRLRSRAGNRQSKKKCAR